MGTGMILAALIVVFVVVTLFKGVRVVPQGFEYTVEQFGKYTNT